MPHRTVSSAEKQRVLHDHLRRSPQQLPPAQAQPNERLRWARIHAGYDSAAAAARALGIATSTYQAHENSNRGFPKSRLAVYARLFKVRIEWLLTGRGNPQRSLIEARIDALSPSKRAQLLSYLEFLESSKD